MQVMSMLWELRCIANAVLQWRKGVYCLLILFVLQVLDPNFRKDYVNLNRWFVTFVNQPEVKAVIGEVQLCEKMAQFDCK